MIVFKTMIISLYVFLAVVCLYYFIEDIVLWINDKIKKLNKKKMKREDFNDLIRFAVILIFVLLLLERTIAYLLNNQ
jgi:polyferredoxin